MLMRYLPTKTEFKFMVFRMPAFILSAVMILASVAMLSTKGLNLGIDFAGGSVIEIEKPLETTVADVREVVGALGLADVGVTEAVGTGADPEPVYIIKFRAPSGTEDVESAQQQANDTVRSALTDAFSLTDDDFRSSAAVGPKVSGELFTAGITALAVALVLMLAYIAFRFEWQYSVGAVAALAHDVIITMGVFSLVSLEFNLTTIAALLTIIGYSMNDTVVVFDRVREEMRRYKKMLLSDVIDFALNGTLSRTMLTSGTTLLALLAIFFLGGPVLRGMSFALIFGVIIGTYSSIFVASSILNTIGVTREKKSIDDVPGFQGV